MIKNYLLQKSVLRSYIKDKILRFDFEDYIYTVDSSRREKRIINLVSDERRRTRWEEQMMNMSSQILNCSTQKKRR